MKTPRRSRSAAGHGVDRPGHGDRVCGPGGTEPRFPTNVTLECPHHDATGDLPRVTARRDRLFGRRHRSAVARRREPAGGLPRADRDRPAPGPSPAQPSARDPRPPRDAAGPSGRGAGGAPGRRDLRRSVEPARRDQPRATSGSAPPRPEPSRRRSTFCSRARPTSSAGAHRRDPDRQRVRWIRRRLARQEGGRGGRDRESGDGDVPVHAEFDPAVAGRRDGRPRLDRLGPVRAARCRQRACGGTGSRRAARAPGTDPRSEAASISAATSRRRSCAGCAAGWRATARADAWPSTRRYLGVRPRGVRPPGQQLPDQGHGVLPRPQAVRVPARDTSCPS